MYTILSTCRPALRAAFAAAGLALGSPRLLIAQDPPPLIKLRPVEVTSTPLPGPNVMMGVVRDTSGIPIPGAEVIIPELRLRLLTNGDGVFRFEGVAKGKHEMRARKLGYAPQIREFALDSAGGVGEFSLVPLTRTLLPLIVSAPGLGIHGVVGDTSFQPIAGAFVRLVGGGMHTETDSLGRFHLPAKPGTHTLLISRVGYDGKLVSLTVPQDSGRRVTAWLSDVTHLPTVNELNNIENLRLRTAWTKPQHRRVFAHDELEKFGSEWVYDAIATTGSRFDSRELYSNDCMVVVNGGPSISNLAHLTVDEVAFVEVFAPVPPPMPVRRPQPSTSITTRGGKSITVPSAMTNINRAVIENGTRSCPLIYAWLR
jgi:hypothetical protein